MPQSAVNLADQSVIRQFFHHSITPALCDPLKFHETKSPLGITKAGSSGPGFLPFGKEVDVSTTLDVLETAAIVKHSKKNGAIEVGGGSPKNFFMQTQPTLRQILYQEKGGHDYFIQLTMDSPQWGGLSGATPQEARSWGKVKEADIDNVGVYSCASLTFAIPCQYVEES